MLFKRDFSAGGLEFSAWLDTHDHAAFVLDMTRDDILPDAMFIIDPDAANPDRKWDDILRKDFETDPEIVRPRENNKYQKLDILYQGLDIYQSAVEHMMAHSGDASGEIIRSLKSFRLNAAAQSAQKRILDNQEILAKTTGTLASAKKTRAKIKSEMDMLGERLATQKAAAGFEPSKAAASKMLKTQAMIEALHEKAEKNNTRAERTIKKIENARREIQEFTERLERLIGLGAEADPIMPVALPEDDDYEEEYDSEPENDSNVRPLLENDPNIVDESKAFKNVEHTEREESDMVGEFKPMQWESKPDNDWAKDTDSVNSPDAERESKLDDVPASEVSSGQADAVPPSKMPSFTPPVSSGNNRINSPLAGESQSASRDAVGGQYAAAHQPAPVMPARPAAAPGAQAQAVVRRDLGNGGKKPSEPGGGYYMLLLVLVVVSIATLYVYQDKLNARILPHLQPFATEQTTHAVPEEDIIVPTVDTVDMTEGSAYAPQLQEEPLNEEPAFLDAEQMDYIQSFNEEPAQEPVYEEPVQMEEESEMPDYGAAPDPLTQDELTEIQQNYIQEEPAYEYTEEIVYDEGTGQTEYEMAVYEDEIVQEPGFENEQLAE
jgi:hypothetical protein